MKEAELSDELRWTRSGACAGCEFDAAALGKVRAVGAIAGRCFAATPATAPTRDRTFHLGQEPLSTGYVLGFSQGRQELRNRVATARRNYSGYSGICTNCQVIMRLFSPFSSSSPPFLLPSPPPRIPSGQLNAPLRLSRRGGWRSPACKRPWGTIETTPGVRRYAIWISQQLRFRPVAETDLHHRD